jgi:hypothetical protein
MWKDYEEYYQLCDRGLRKKSLEKLADFVNTYKTFSIAEQIKFVKFACEFAENMNDRDRLPYPLTDELKKTLLIWIENESRDSRPFRWLSKYFYEDFTEKALKINPKDDKTRDFLINKLIYDIWYSTHHLPGDGYTGDPKDDLQRAKLAKYHIDLLTDLKRQEYLNNELNDEMKMVTDYIDWQNSQTNLDFKTWGLKNNKFPDNGLEAFYYKK